VRPSWDRLSTRRRSKQRAGRAGGVEVAVGLAAACGFDPVRMSGDVVVAPPSVLRALR
jgi:hypothetical protein